MMLWPEAHAFLWHDLLVILVALGAVVVSTTGLFLVLFEIRALRVALQARLDHLEEAIRAAAVVHMPQAGPEPPTTPQAGPQEHEEVI